MGRKRSQKPEKPSRALAGTRPPSSSADRILAEIADLDLFLTSELRKIVGGKPQVDPAPMVGSLYQPTITSTTR